MSREVHDKFVEIKIHTAKCDNCNKHNTAIIFRCQTCGQQCCTPCWQRKGGDDKHRLNGGDQGFAVPSEVLGRRKRESAIVSKKKRARRLTARKDEDDGDDNYEDDNGEGYAEAIATRENKARNENSRESGTKSRNRFGKSTETEMSPTASGKQVPEKEPSPSILTAAERLLSQAVSSRIHAAAVSRLRPRPHTRAVAESHEAITPATANAPPSTYISPYPSSASDYDGITALLRAAEYIENDKLPSPSPPGVSPRLLASRGDEDKDEDEDEEWGQDAQPRSPLFIPEGIDLTTDSGGDEAEERRTQREDLMLQLDGAQDKVPGIEMDEEAPPTERVSKRRRLDKNDGYDEETEDEDWLGKIGDAKGGPTRNADKARTSRGLDRDVLCVTQTVRRTRRDDPPVKRGTRD